MTSDDQTSARNFAVVEQALYGERNGAHALLSRSGGAAPFAEIATYTDRPSTPPPGTVWSAYNSIFTHGQYLVLTRTEPDPKASRDGMVRTHALILPVDQAIEISNLDILADHFTESGNESALSSQIALDPLQIPLMPRPAERYPSAQASPRMLSLATELLNSSSGAAVVWVGQEGFWEAVTTLWKGLWPRARKNFSARLSFGPQDIEGQSPTILVTPDSLTGRWPPTQFRLVRPRASHPAGDGTVSAAVALLAADPRGDELRTLLDQIGAPLTKAQDLRLLEQALKLVGEPNPTADSVRSLARILGKLAPLAADGSALKRQVTSDLALLTVDVNSVAALANFGQVSRALPGSDAVFRAVEEWIVEESVSTTNTDQVGANAVANVLLRGFSPSTLAPAPGGVAESHEWHQAVRCGATRLLQHPTWPEAIGQAVWKWCRQVPELITPLADFIPTGVDVESLLLAQTPRALKENVAVPLLNFAASRSWWRLHAAIAVAWLPPVDAVRLHLSVDANALSLNGVQELVARITPRDLLTAAIEIGDERLIEFAGIVSAQAPEVLQPNLVQSAPWRAIWLASIHHGTKPWDVVTDRHTTTAELADITIASNAVSEQRVSNALWTALAAEVDTDLLVYPARASLWTALRPDTRALLIAETADRWLANLALDPLRWAQSADALEPELETEITAPPRIARTLREWGSRASAGAAAVAVLFRSFPSMREESLVQWLPDLVSSPSALSPSPALALGRTIRERKWATAAKILGTAALERIDLLPAAEECEDLVGVVLRLRLHANGSRVISITDVWSALHEIGCELYSSGPTARHLWKRSGGAASDLRTDGSGRDRWEDAIELCKLGAGPEGRVLLNRMLEDFPGNATLQWLARTAPFPQRESGPPKRWPWNWT